MSKLNERPLVKDALNFEKIEDKKKIIAINGPETLKKEFLDGEYVSLKYTTGGRELLDRLFQYSLSGCIEKFSHLTAKKPAQLRSARKIW